MAALMVSCVLLALLAPGIGSAEPQVRTALRVLVLDDGSPSVGAVAAELQEEGVAHTTVSLLDGNAPDLSDDYLVTESEGLTTVNFQGVVIPSSASAHISADSYAAIRDAQAAHGIRVFSAYNWANPTLGLTWASYTGPLDGAQTTVTADGLNDSWSYLTGELQFEDGDPNVTESYGYIANPRIYGPSDPHWNPDEEPFVFTTILSAPAQGSQGALLGVHESGGRETLISTFAFNEYQMQFQALAPGIVDWLTRGVRLGMQRNHLTMHVDDVLLADDRWNMDANCTYPGDCPPGEEYRTEPIRMTADDVTAVTQWQDEQGFVLDMAFNGHGREGSQDQLSSALLADVGAFRWINHTWSHPYLGCVQDFSVVPWACAADEAGGTQWHTEREIRREIRRNLNWAGTWGIPLDPAALITGEHSSLASLPQMPTDNPNLIEALERTGVSVIASDASREPEQRTIGSAKTLPRYPTNVYYNVATEAESIDLYNWIYTSEADGGSGVCELNPLSTCIPVITDPNGYHSVILPVQTRIAMSHVLGNDPRPHYAHQSNLAEDRVLLPMLEQVLGTYRALLNSTAPLVSPDMVTAADTIARQDRWESEADSVQAFVVGEELVVTAPQGATVPLTVPEGTVDAGFLEPYAGSLSGWFTSDGTELRLGLPGSAVQQSPAQEAAGQPDESAVDPLADPAGVPEPKDVAEVLPPAPMALVPEPSQEMSAVGEK